MKITKKIEKKIRKRHYKNKAYRSLMEQIAADKAAYLEKVARINERNPLNKVEQFVGVGQADGHYDGFPEDWETPMMAEGRRFVEKMAFNVSAPDMRAKARVRAILKEEGFTDREIH